MIDTRFETAVSWAQKTTPLLVRFGPIPKLLSEESWRKWAATVVSLPSIAAIGTPRPERFDTWRRWARSFNQSVRILVSN